ncbi:MAG: hypothetical protein AAFP77_20455 [Bacteroidota bacterium]
MPTIAPRTVFPLLLLFAISFLACKKEETPPSGATDKMLRVKFQFDPNQERLDNLGNPSTVPSDHATQTPSFNGLSIHFLELVADEFTPYQQGAFVFKGKEVSASNSNPYGFTTAIDFDQALVAGEDEMFVEVPLADIAAGTYQHLRVSVAYQNYDVRYNLNNIPVINSLSQQFGTIASFVGYNTHINNLQVNTLEVPVNATHLQGFWAFETQLAAPYDSYNQIFTGQAPANATTVVNPFPNAPIPAGSCVVAGSLDLPLQISGEEQENVELTLSFSINGSFEWIDRNGNGEWDIDVSNSSESEPVVDMGLRGLKAFWD